MNISHRWSVFVFVLGIFASANLALASPTGSPLTTYPVQPCRFLDTRTSLGALQGGNAMDVYVRGSALLASHGAQRADCEVPPEAEAVVINVQAILPTSGGNLRVNATGSVQNPMGAYSRLNYRVGENDANEMVVGLCNIYQYPNPQVPCGDPGPRYLDFQILNGGPAGSSVHIVSEVVGYLARPKFASAWGTVESIVVTPDVYLNSYIFHLDNGIRLSCGALWEAQAGCADVQVGDKISVVAHAEESATGVLTHHVQGVINIKP